ncbi:glycosyltransferase family 4 protein [Schumannella luteola]
MPFEALHLGRSGEFPGGMTQVINDYLAWPFPRFRQAVIATRSTSFWRTLGLLPHAVWRVGRLRSRRDAVVVSHLSQGGSFLREGALSVLAYATGTAVVAHIHGSSFAAFSERHRRLARWVLDRTDAVCVLDPSMRDAVARLGAAAPVVVVPNAVSSAPQSALDRVVVYAGGVSRRKGLPELVDAWSRVIGAEDWELNIAGPVVDDIELALPPGATTVGPLPREELRRLLERASIAVLPSHAEGMPLFALEALASGVPLIATDVGAVAELIELGTGELVAAGDADELAAALSGLVADPERVRSLSRRARSAHREHYSPEAIMPLLERTWLTALARRDDRSPRHHTPEQGRREPGESE